ncbi:SLC13 family permease, partial [Francisellaceae bacterium]|nr:SLC13 family permease [Francisellaceae bacterium]
YLLGVFIIGSALEDSQLVEKLALKLCHSAVNQKRILLKLVYLFGISSALLLNDTVAIIGASVVVILINSIKAIPRPYIYATAFSVTIGSVMSPIGNPQNLLIANAFQSGAFIYFFTYLFIPTMICLFICYWVITKIYSKALSQPIQFISENITINPYKRIICLLSLVVFLLLVVMKILLSSLDNSVHISFAIIALVPAIFILLLYPSRTLVMKNIDWRTIVFFIGMFVLIHAVWLTGILQYSFNGHHNWFNHVLPVLIISIILSQIVSNAPMVILVLPLIASSGGGQTELLALAAGSTIAGNFTILGAASNVIIFQYAIRKGIDCFSFGSFIVIGSLITLPCILIYYLFLTF